MNIKERYRPYNFSSTKCHVIQLDFRRDGIYGIDYKLPLEIGVLKGIYVTANVRSIHRIIGGVLLNFNESLIKCFQMPLHNILLLKDRSHPIPFNEEIFSNSIMQGFYVIRGEQEIPPRGYIKIYLHYEPRT